MHVSLTPKLEELVRRKLERLRAALVAGEQSGLAEDFSMDQLMAQLDDEARAEALLDG